MNLRPSGYEPDDRASDFNWLRESLANFEAAEGTRGRIGKKGASGVHQLGGGDAGDVGAHVGLPTEQPAVAPAHPPPQLDIGFDEDWADS